MNDHIENSTTRVGVIDVGSNSVRLVVFDGVARSPAYFFNEKVLCGLGRGLAESGRLNPDGRLRAMAALKRFATLLRGMNVETVSGVATAAVREASDGSKFVKEVLAQTGIALQVATGVEEAELSAKGILLGWRDADGIVCDIGGASMELALIEKGAIGKCETSPLGPLKLKDFTGDLDTHIDSEVAKLLAAIGQKRKTLFLVGGSWRALARLDMVRRNYPFHVLHEYRLTHAQIHATVDWVLQQNAQELQTHTDTSAERLALVPMAAKVMDCLVEHMQPPEIVISSYGLREGMLFNAMPPSMRRLDPLLEACRQMERSRARFPGFGQVLYTWLRPIYRDKSDAEKRLILAACLLHDTSWQAHPDYRAEMCFESVTRANLGGVNHRDRLFLGLAILSRYKNAGLDAPVMALMEEADINTAKILGKAMRLGAMIAGAQTTLSDAAKIAIEGNELVLELMADGHELNGEIVEKRLSSLARLMELTPRIDLV